MNTLERGEGFKEQFEERQPESVLLFQRRAVGVIRRSAGDPGRDTDKPGRFLLPVKGRLQGKRQGC